MLDIGLFYIPKLALEDLSWEGMILRKHRTSFGVAGMHPNNLDRNASEMGFSKLDVYAT